MATLNQESSEQKTSWSWAEMGIVPPEPPAELEFDADDNLGCMRALWTCAKLFTFVGLFVWVVVELAKELGR